jgi:hypothetical protein
MDPETILSENEKSLRKELSKNLHSVFQLNFYICAGDEKIGWCYGTQTDHESFYLANAAILPAYRRKRIISSIIPVLIKQLGEKGFQKIYSRHAATNNNVLIPLLRAGFVITGFELNDMDGLMVRLSYFTNELRRKVVDFRVGKTTLTKEIAEALSLKIQ